MNCDTRQEQASLLMDGELREPDQPVLFRHLEECAECRGFLDSLIRLRMATRSDQEAILGAADQVLPDWSPPAVESRPVAAGPWLKIFAGRWRLPVPVSVGLAVILLAGGAILGSRFAVFTERAGSFADGMSRVEPAVVVVCGMPQVDVVALNPER